MQIKKVYRVRSGVSGRWDGRGVESAGIEVLFGNVEMGLDESRGFDEEHSETLG